MKNRWNKLKDELWDKTQGNWNISKVPEIYDAVKFDLVHHPTLAPEHLAPVYDVATQLNDVLVPNEYGHAGKSRAWIGAVVCDKLLRKLLQDLRSSVDTGPAPEALPERPLVTASQDLRGSLSSGRMNDDEEDEAVVQEMEYVGIDPSHASTSSTVVKSVHRRVRTRLYFTSESHIQTLMNVLRYDPDDSMQGLVGEDAKKRLCAEPIFDYLSQIVFRLYEDKLAPPERPERYMVEVLFSPGASGHPVELAGSTHIMPVEELRLLHPSGKPLTLKQVQLVLGQYVNNGQGSPKARHRNSFPLLE